MTQNFDGTERSFVFKCLRLMIFCLVPGDGAILARYITRHEEQGAVSRTQGPGSIACTQRQMALETRATSRDTESYHVRVSSTNTSAAISAHVTTPPVLGRGAPHFERLSGRRRDRRGRRGCVPGSAAMRDGQGAGVRRGWQAVCVRQHGSLRGRHHRPLW